MYNLQTTVTALVLGLTVSASCGQNPNADGRGRIDLPILTGQTETVGCLGVPPVQVSQLKLPRRVGLVVYRVIADSPAAKADIGEHDVLHKLNDQLLINAHQLAVLVRSSKDDDKVKLTIIRGGQTMVVPVTIEAKALPVLGDGSDRRPYHLNVELPGGTLELHPWWLQLTPQQEQAVEQYLERTLRESRQSMEELREEMEQMLTELRQQSSEKAEQLSEQLDRWWDKAKIHTDDALESLQQALRAEPAKTIVMGDKLFVYSDDEHQITVEENSQGHVSLTIITVAGQSLYQGPLNSTGELKSIPEALRDKMAAVMEYLAEAIELGDLQIIIAHLDDEDED